MSKINVPFALVSLATSILLWASVYNSNNRQPDTKIVNPLLNIKNLNESKYVVTEIPNFTTVTLSGYSDQIRAATQQTPAGIVDLSNPKIGTADYPVIIFPTAVRDLAANGSPPAHIKIEALMTKRFEVSVLKSGSLMPGYHETEVDRFPRFVYVTGPAETVQKVNAVQVPLNLSTINQSPSDIDLEPKAVDLGGTAVPKIMLSETEEQHPAYHYFDVIENTLKIRVTYKYDPDAPTLPKK